MSVWRKTHSTETPGHRRKGLFRFCLLAMAFVAGTFYLTANLQAASPSRIELKVDRVAPREVEEQTAKAIVRDYGNAWTALGKALEQNRIDQLGDLWVGFARQQLGEAIDRQKQSGLRIRYVDHGHKLEGFFYSPEGSALELRDTAQLERRVLDGDKIIASDSLVAH
jgi:hypothetical protein